MRWLFLDFSSYECVRSRAVSAVLVLFLGALLTACSGSGGGYAQSGDTGVQAAADDSEARKLARIRLELASSYFENGQVSVALDEIKQALMVDPDFAQAYNLRALAYMRLSNNALAQENFRRALSLSPRDPDVLHNYAWFLCQQGHYAESFPLFEQAIASPAYGTQSKSWMTLGMCQAKSAQLEAAEKSLLHAYELDAANPVAAYNLADVLYKRSDLKRAQFYLRRLNRTEFANAQTLWLGIKVEHSLNDVRARRQLAEQLQKRYPQSREAVAYEKGAFYE